MMKTSSKYKEVHPNFKLNGITNGFNGLKEVAYSLIKEGHPHEKSIGDFLNDWLDNKTDLEVKTSGSTGIPKTISLQKQHMVNSAIATGEFFELKPGDTSLLCLSTDYIAGKMMLVRAMVLGLELDYVVPSSNPLQEVEKEFDFCAMVPLQLEHSINKIDTIKTLLVGGGTFPNVLKEKLYDKSTAVFETYGMTETVTHIAVKSINVRQGKADSQNPFTALPNIKLSKDDRDCLVIEAPKVADQPVSTNDIVNLISKFEFEWLGRFDNIINSGGIKLIPEQIEAKLKSVLDDPFFVAGIPDETLGEKLILIVEGEIDESRIMEKVRSLKTLSKFEVPKMIYEVLSFSYTETGKVNRSKTLTLAIR